MKTRRSHRIVPRAALALPLVIPLTLLAACGTTATPAAQTGPAGAAVAGGSAAGQAAGSADAASGSPTAAPTPSGSPTPAPSPTAPAGTRVPGAANCPMFPADNVWNTDISKLPVNSHSAAWLRSMNSAHTLLHPDFGPNEGGYPYGIPFNVVTSAHATGERQVPVRERERHGPLPVRHRHPDRGRQERRRRPARHHGRTSSTCTLYELYDARYSAHSTAGSGAIWSLRSNTLRPCRLDLGRRRGPADPARAAELRAGHGGGQGRPADHARDPVHRDSHPGGLTCGRPGTRRARPTAPACRRWAPGSG